MPDTRPPPLAEVPPDLIRFADAVRAIDDHGRLDHARIVEALDAFADALDLLGSDRLEERAMVRSAAERLASSRADSDFHTDLVRLGLDSARRVMANGRPRDRWQLSAYSGAIARFGDAIGVIDVDRPLLEQHGHVVTALSAAVDAFEIALGVSLAVPSS